MLSETRRKVIAYDVFLIVGSTLKLYAWYLATSSGLPTFIHLTYNYDVSPVCHPRTTTWTD